MTYELEPSRAQRSGQTETAWRRLPLACRRRAMRPRAASAGCVEPRPAAARARSRTACPPPPSWARLWARRVAWGMWSAPCTVACADTKPALASSAGIRSVGNTLRSPTSTVGSARQPSSHDRTEAICAPRTCRRRTPRRQEGGAEACGGWHTSASLSFETPSGSAAQCRCVFAKTTAPPARRPRGVCS